MKTIETRRQFERITIVDNETLTRGADANYTVTEDDIPIGQYNTGVILVTVGTETATATLDVAFYVKDSNGNSYEHTSITQITSAGSSKTNITQIYGETGKVVVTLGDAQNDAYAGVTVELILKS